MPVTWWRIDSLNLTTRAWCCTRPLQAPNTSTQMKRITWLWMHKSRPSTKREEEKDQRRGKLWASKSFSMSRVPLLATEWVVWCQMMKDPSVTTINLWDRSPSLARLVTKDRHLRRGPSNLRDVREALLPPKPTSKAVKIDQNLRHQSRETRTSQGIKTLWIIPFLVSRSLKRPWRTILWARTPLTSRSINHQRSCNMTPRTREAWSSARKISWFRPSLNFHRTPSLILGIMVGKLRN